MDRQPNQLRIVVIGAGFGGLQTAQSLSKSGAEVLLIDRHNYHTFVPLLYQVAAAQVPPETVAYPVRTLLRRTRNLRFLQAEVTRVNFAQRQVETREAVIAYDYLVLATGSQPQHLGIPGVSEHGFMLKTLAQAVALRNHLLHCFEQAERETDPQIRQRLLTVVIVGGGPTGVELAGTLVELKQALRRDYPGLDLGTLQIVLVQSGDRLLPNLPARLGRYTTRKLRRLGVNVHLETRVSRVTSTTVTFAQGPTLGTETVIWAAGLEAALPAVATPPPTGAKQKLKVRATLQLLHEPQVYAIGDVAQGEEPLTGVAPEALQQGVAVARNLRRQLRGQAPKSFHYFNKGRLAIIGGWAGVGKIGPLLLTGWLPWLLWLGVHLVYLPGWRNRLVLLLSWLQSYGLGDRPLRLILSSPPLTPPPPSQRLPAIAADRASLDPPAE
ncbi:MAG: NAD(P)/FAD-dependent oxidoreductase [Leptolyngbya sp. RL_3_1]|nr:NAD(P)/FAD-dependent oxidoreductase [Leptolyngbya sp. RL_3_1]